MKDLNMKPLKPLKPMKPMKRIRFFTLSAIAGIAMGFGNSGAAHAENCGSEYFAQPGETLAGVAYKCGTSLGALTAANPDLAGTVGLRSGIVLKVPEIVAAQSSPTTPYRFFTPGMEGMPAQLLPSPNGAMGPSYLVQEGDTLGGIATRFQTSVWDILLVNPQLKNPHLLQTGSFVRLPYGSTANPLADRPTSHDSHKISVVPVPTPSGTVLSVHVKQFPAHQKVRLNLGRSASQSAVVSGGRTDNRGELRVDFPVPTAMRGLSAAVVTAEIIGSRYSAQSDTVFLPLHTATSRSRTKAAEPAASKLEVGKSISVEGFITDEGKSCPALRDETGELYTLTATDAIFRPGDTVRIKGIVAPADWCAQGISVAVASAQTRTERATASDADMSYQPPKPHARPRVSNEKAKTLTFPKFGFASDAHIDGVEVLSVGTDVDVSDTQQFVRGIIVNDNSRCTIVRGEDGSTYAVAAQLRSVKTGERIEMIGHTVARDPCGQGVGFKVEKARRYSKYGS